LAFVDVPANAVEFTASAGLTPLRLSDAAERAFCKSCGSPISMAYVAERQTLGLVMGSVDPSSIEGKWPKPRRHIFLSEKAPWVTVPDDGMPRFENSSDPNLKIEPYSKPK
jgi:hypothetical protein